MLKPVRQSICLSLEERRALEAIAERQSRSMGSVLREAFLQHIAAEARADRHLKGADR